MRSDYLWEKKGSDPEVEGLEELLSDYKYVATAPPLVVAPRVGMSFRWLLAPVAIAVATVSAIWTGGGSGDSRWNGAADEGAVVVETIPFIAMPRMEAPLASTHPPLASAEYVSSRLRRPRPVKRAIPAHATTITAEEKHAYEQVLLALYITGRQLKNVHDTINGIEDDPKPGKDR